MILSMDFVFRTGADIEDLVERLRQEDQTFKLAKKINAIAKRRKRAKANYPFKHTTYKGRLVFHEDSGVYTASVEGENEGLCKFDSRPRHQIVTVFLKS